MVTKLERTAYCIIRIEDLKSFTVIISPNRNAHAHWRQSNFIKWGHRCVSIFYTICYIFYLSKVFVFFFFLICFKKRFSLIYILFEMQIKMHYNIAHNFMHYRINTIIVCNMSYNTFLSFIFSLNCLFLSLILLKIKMWAKVNIKYHSHWNRFVRSLCTLLMNLYCCFYTWLDNISN